MNSDAATTIRQRLEALKPQVLEVARRYGTSNLRIYGSIATGQEHPASDLDLLIDLPKGQSLLGLISLRQELEDLLGCPVDVNPGAQPLAGCCCISRFHHLAEDLAHLFLHGVVEGGHGSEVASSAVIAVNASDEHGRGLPEGLFDSCPGCSMGKHRHSGCGIAFA